MQARQPPKDVISFWPSHKAGFSVEPGNTGHWPVPSSDPPDGTGAAHFLQADTVPPDREIRGSKSAFSDFGFRRSFGLREFGFSVVAFSARTSTKKLSVYD
jgi:hypothetical protein